jgi:hypothetical protein
MRRPLFRVFVHGGPTSPALRAGDFGPEPPGCPLADILASSLQWERVKSPSAFGALDLSSQGTMLVRGQCFDDLSTSTVLGNSDPAISGRRTFSPYNRARARSCRASAKVQSCASRPTIAPITLHAAKKAQSNPSCCRHARETRSLLNRGGACVVQDQVRVFQAA